MITEGRSAKIETKIKWFLVMYLPVNVANLIYGKVSKTPVYGRVSATDNAMIVIPNTEKKLIQ